MLEVLGNEPLLKNTVDGYAPRPDYRPQTKFETRGLAAGPRRSGPDLQASRLMLYPQIEPYRHGYLDTGDGHQIHWELCGNPQASRRSSCMAARQRLLAGAAPAVRSQPVQRARPARLPLHAARQPGAQHHLAPGRADIERLRTEIMGADKWLVFGGSWGSTLSLAMPRRIPPTSARAGARHLHGAQRRDPLVLPGRRCPSCSRTAGGIPGADPRGRARRPGPGLSQHA